MYTRKYKASYLFKTSSWAWWHRPVTPTHGRRVVKKKERRKRRRGREEEKEG